MLEIAVLSFLIGMVMTLVVQYMWVKYRLGQLPPTPPPVKDQFPKIQVPKNIKEQCGREDLSKQKEPCLWFNLVNHFLFQELRDTEKVRRWMMKKMNFEFAELLQTVSGKFVDQITVRDFSLGHDFPILNNITVRNVSLTEGGMEELDLGVDVDYAGGFQIAMDIMLLFSKSAYLSVTIKSLKGPARFQLTRSPYTHWSFSFVEDPVVEFAVESQFEGKGLPQITNFIISQIRRSIRKKHTLPNFKMRYKPFFTQPAPPRPLHEFRVNGQNISVGKLKVTVVQCSRLLKTPPDAKLYCTISVDQLEWRELVSLKQRVWLSHDIEVIKGQATSIGMTFREENLLDRFDVAIIVDNVIPDSPAERADIRRNDVLISVGTCKITSCRQAAKLMKSAGEKFIIRLERPQLKMLQEVKFFEESVSYKESEDTTEDTHNEESEDFVHISFKPSQDGDLGAVKSVKLDKSSSSGLLVPTPGEPTQMRVRSNISHSAEGSPVKRSHRKSDPRLQAFDTGQFKRDVSPRRERAESDPCLVMKAPPDESDNLYSMEVDSDSDDDFYNVQKIPEIDACKDPVWNKDVTFDLGEQHRYLNICVRCKIPEKVDKSERVIKVMRDLLLGHVSLSLSDVTLYCLLTMQGDTQQIVHLQPGDMKAGASRPKSDKWVNHAGFDSVLCYGDIKLAFHFTPMKLNDLDRSRVPREPADPSVVECVTSRDLTKEDVTTGLSEPSKLPVEGLHDLTLTQFQSATYCNFCGKKIWMKTAYRCSTCTMICHKKCVEKCQNETSCTKEGPMRRSNPSIEWRTPVAVRKKAASDESRTVRLLSKFRSRDPTSSSALSLKVDQPSTSPRSSPVLGRKMTDQGTSPSPSPRHSPRPSPRPSPRHSPTTIKRLHFFRQDQGRDDPNNSSDSEEEKQGVLRRIHDNQSKTKGTNLDETVVTAAKQMGRELFAHLNVEERKQKLDQMVSKLQEEIDHETDNKSQLSDTTKSVTDAGQRRYLEDQMAKSEEKIDAMMMLLLHYCAGLQHCLDAEEEGRQRSEQSGETTQQEQGKTTPSEETPTSDVAEETLTTEDTEMVLTSENLSETGVGGDDSDCGESSDDGGIVIGNFNDSTSTSQKPADIV